MPLTPLVTSTSTTHHFSLVTCGTHQRSIPLNSYTIPSFEYFFQETQVWVFTTENIVLVHDELERYSQFLLDELFIQQGFHFCDLALNYDPR